jgi:hypothetical protein
VLRAEGSGADRLTHYALRFPRRISAEVAFDYAAGRNEYRLHFDGGDDRLTVVLSREQVNVLAGLQPTDPGEMARDLYVAGHIDIDEFERRLTLPPR